MFDTLEECHQKLGGTIVLRDKKPFYVHSAVGPDRVQGWIVGTRDQGQVVVDVSALDFKSLGQKLGYLNATRYGQAIYNEATYLMKQAIRRSTQGLSEYNVYVSGFKGDDSPERPGTGQLRFTSSFYTDNFEGFQAMLDNKYPTVSEVRRMMEDRSIQSRAFHRWWAIERDPVGPFYFCYKNQRVGYTEDFSRVVMQDRFRFLREDLRELKVA